jgi:hypothetical protein
MVMIEREARKWGVGGEIYRGWHVQGCAVWQATKGDKDLVEELGADSDTLFCSTADTSEHDFVLEGPEDYESELD